MAKYRVSSVFLAAAAVVIGGALAPSAMAQTPAGEGRFYIELKDATLSDALKLIFKAAGNPSYVIDPQAEAINVGSITFNNVLWSSAVRQLANQNDFKYFKNESGTWVVEPRPSQKVDGKGAIGAPGMPGMPGAGTRPAITTRRNPQQRPVATTAGADAVASADDEDEKEYRILRVNHIYAGGIALLFGGQQIPTEAFLSPSAGGGQSGGGGFGGNNGGGFGGGQFGGNNNGGQFGGNNGGGQFGGGGGGFGGGQFGGGGGGFGGNTGGGGGGFGGFGGRF